jgi:hypothetical protein
MTREAPQAALLQDKEVQTELVHALLKKIKAGESRDTVLQGIPEELKKQIEEELDREESAKTEKTPSSALIPAEYRGLTSTALQEQWIVEVNSPEAELEKNRKISALEALKREEAELVAERTKEIERAARVQRETIRIGELRREMEREDGTPTMEPVTFSEEEIASLLSESTNRDSFRTHLKHRYIDKLASQDVAIGELTRYNSKAVPDFMREEMTIRHGSSQE